jgi:small subunit ribosomal protein S16
MTPKIKLQRVGTKRQPKYRVVVQEARSKLGGKVIEILGIYQPRQNPAVFEVSKEKVLEWLKKGAQPTEKVRILLGKAGIMPPVDLAALHKRPSKGEKKEAAAPAAAQPAKEAKPKEEVKPEPKEEAKPEPKEEAKPAEA